MLEHPGISNALLTGYPDGKEPMYPHCPICGAECETLYKDSHGDYVGCDECLQTIFAWEAEDCFPNDDNDDEED